MREILVFLAIGLAAGWAAAKLLGGKDLGLPASLVVGCIGALLGGALFRQLGIAIAGVPVLISHFVAALVGSLLLLLVIRFVKNV
jgi:uncharacterized membrane protein YeaQ/YmgE (transglycosylase-associated protein family)